MPRRSSTQLGVVCFSFLLAFCLKTTNKIEMKNIEMVDGVLIKPMGVETCNPMLKVKFQCQKQAAAAFGVETRLLALKLEFQC